MLRSWESHRHQFFPVGETMTIQSERDLTDINNVVAKYQRTGQLPLPTKQAQYGDVSELNRPLGELIQQYQESLEILLVRRLMLSRRLMPRPLRIWLLPKRLSWRNCEN